MPEGWRGDPASAAVLALFERRDSLLTAVRTLRTLDAGTLTAFAPAYDEELVELTTNGSSAVEIAALVGALAGCLAGFALPFWMRGQWPTLIVSGKPLMSIPPLVLVAFELMLLLASCGIVAAFLRRCAMSRRRSAVASDPAFTDSRYGLLVRCDPPRAAGTIDLLREAGALECRIV
ncbi:MAG TPA: quinol:electron acceptor oxidoreductase subunit ActD [Vicinamibacterales bacterium]|nr:quinol:electron acceptor oxidoreductase subunit ActD [Vicinamibacterales bacterium]